MGRIEKEVCLFHWTNPSIVHPSEFENSVLYREEVERAAAQIYTQKRLVFYGFTPTLSSAFITAFSQCIVLDVAEECLKVSAVPGH